MKFDIAAIFEQIVTMYARLPLAQKVAIPVLVAGTSFVIVFVSRWASRPDYQLLFSNLEEADAAAVVETLKEKKIGFQLRDDGRTIDVTPPDKVHELRLELASAGLPKGGNVGFEIFNENTLGQTGFVEGVKYVRALQGELERTIRAIDVVKAVRVHITQPQKSVFVSRDVLPTASVLLRLKPGAELTPPQIKGIAHLVSGSVERLTPENVAIMDSNGAMLNKAQDEKSLDGADLTQLEYKQSVETAYARRIESMLAEILGPGKAVARVTASIDFNKYDKEEEAYDPSGRVMRSERSIEEGATASAEGGVPGVASNLTNEPGLLTAPDSSKKGSLHSESVKNYEVSRAVSKTTGAAGAIERVTAAVLVDGTYDTATSGAKDANGNPVVDKKYKPLTAEMLRQIDNLVRQAIGFDTTRGDVVTVENIRFFEPDANIEAALGEDRTWIKIFSLLPYISSALVLIVLFVLVKPLIKFLVKPPDAEVDLSRLLPTGIEELEAELEAEKAKISLIPEGKGKAIDLEEIQELLGENSRIVKENPQQAALLIRYWINEGSV